MSSVKRVIERAEAGGPPPREPRPRNVDAFTEVVATRVEKSKGSASPHPPGTCTTAMWAIWAPMLTYIGK